MGIARKISQTAAGWNHPMFEGKPLVFDAFISHEDMITAMPENSTVLAGNAFTDIQAAEIVHQGGTFWGTQYHPEYTLHEMARLIVAREEKLIAGGFFQCHDDVMSLVNQMEALAQCPDRKDLRWRLAIDDDLLSDSIRQCEFKNWLFKMVIPRSFS